MKKILLVLAMIAASVFLAQPAVADDDPVAAAATTDGDTGNDTAQEEEATPEALPEDPPQAAPDAPQDTTTPPASEDNSSDAPDTKDEPAPAGDENKAEEPGDENAGNSPPAVEAAPVKIKICHSTSSETNPYVENSPNASGDLHGHTGHTGGIFPADGWGDIIPPFTFGNVNFPGMNWTDAGQAIYNNNCNLPNEVPVPLINATAVPPTATPPNCAVDGTLVLPTTTGVIYEATPAGTGPGDYTVTASAAVNYVLTNPLYEEHITVLPKLTGPQCVIAGLSPTAAGASVSPATCSANGGLVLDNTDKVFYIVIPIGTLRIVTALPKPGYYMTNFPFLKFLNIPQKLTGSQCDSVDLTICHRTNSNVNPYNAIGPATAGVANGHDTEHEGPIWNPTLKANHVEWGDIIPPYHYNDMDYPGQNWTPEGIAFYNDGACDGAGIIPTELTAEAPIADPATCEEDGSLVLAETPNVVYTVEPVYDGPGKYTVTASVVDEEFVLTGQTVFNVTVDEKLPTADCVSPEEGGEDPAKEDDLLPDTGGLPLWILLIAGPMTAAGLIILMRREPVSRTSTGGGMPSYSLILPPAPKPLGIKRAHATTEHIGFMKAVGNVVAAIGSFLRGGRR
ncbi:hypothetical protein [Aeromicrobium sp. 9AM]|uniref:hypothetical protein n=1 Tax=Aeromicrobium sp. 9AM TaxID=2653126 RepID=UPI0012F3A0D3|nr:hypothetical protein [Aeromicrobium sp. 9AM]VXC22011.1 conserved exported hypothetical protein [Aeromicrobium sp. 9AM]